MKRTFEIALSGVATALGAIFLILGTLNPVMQVTGWLIGTVAMMLPISREFPLGGFLSYLASVLLTILLGGMSFLWRLLPFIAFFGLHPLANYFQLKFRINRWVAYIVKALWFDGMLAIVFYVLAGGVSPIEAINTYIIPIILVGGTILFFFYDYLIFSCQITVNKIVDKIKR